VFFQGQGFAAPVAPPVAPIPAKISLTYLERRAHACHKVILHACDAYLETMSHVLRGGWLDDHDPQPETKASEILSEVWTTYCNSELSQTHRLPVLPKPRAYHLTISSSGIEHFCFSIPARHAPTYQISESKLTMTVHQVNPFSLQGHESTPGLSKEVEGGRDDCTRTEAWS
jgi:hypothetical protein